MINDSPQKQAKSFSDVLNTLSPKTAAIAGAVGVLVIEAVIGFVVMLILFFGNGVNAKTGAIKNTNTTPTANTTPSTAPTTTDIAAISDSDYVRGDKNAKVSIVEYSDMECPYCKRFHETLKQVVADYNGKVNWVYRHFPLDSLHSKARNEALAAECAGSVGGKDKFWEYLDLVFTETPGNNGLDSAELPKFAERVGIDRTKFDKCMIDKTFADKITAQIADATKSGGRGTPYSVLVAGDKEVPLLPAGALPIDQVKSAIDNLLK